jgi:hypothetical protein
MIDALADSTVAAYLQGVLAASGYGSFTVVTGMQDNLPELACPYLVVHSEIERFAGRDPVFELRTKIELHSLTGITAVSDLEALMSVVDGALIDQAELSVPTPGLVYFGWEGVQRSEQTSGDRRINLREIHVFSQLGS